MAIELEQNSEINPVKINIEKPIIEEIKTDKLVKLKLIKHKISVFIDTNNYTSIAIGTGVLIGVGLLVKHILKRGR